MNLAVSPLQRLLAILTRRAWVTWLIALLFVLRIGKSVIAFVHPEWLGQTRAAVDYSAFFVSGRLAIEGAIAHAYRLDDFVVAQDRILGTSAFLPWTYPPHFNLITAALALLPIWLGYLMLASASLIAWWLAMRRLAGPASFGLVLMAMWPAMLVCLNTGQNGLMFGALMALLARHAVAGHAGAAVPLALLTMKPHLLTGVGLWLLIGRQWRTILLGGLLTLALLSLTTWLLDPSVWPAFLAAGSRVAGYLEAGRFPLQRMISLYAGFSRAGLGSGMALALHAAVALAWLAAILQAWRLDWPPRQQLAVAIVATLMLTPYSYDYDLPVLATALALLAADIEQRGRPWQIVLMLLLLWAAGSAGAQMTDGLVRGPGMEDAARALPSLGGFLLQPAAVLMLWMARQAAPADRH